MFCHLGLFFFFSLCLGTAVNLRGGSLGVPGVGQGNAGRCAAERGGGAEREQWRLPHSPPSFNLSLQYPQSNWAPLVLVP